MRTSPGRAKAADPGGIGRRTFLSRVMLGTAGTVAASFASGDVGQLVALAVEEGAPVRQMTPSRQKPSHEDLMRRAIALSKQVPEVPFGAVIVRRLTGDIVAEGWNRSSENPTLHGEIDAINRCAAAHRLIDWTGLDLYTTAEPCVMCQGAVEWAGINTVYYGTSIPYLTERGWSAIDIRAAEVARRTPFRRTGIVGGILEAECNALFDAAPRGRFKT